MEVKNNSDDFIIIPAETTNNYFYPAPKEFPNINARLWGEHDDYSIYWKLNRGDDFSKFLWLPDGYWVAEYTSNSQPYLDEIGEGNFQILRSSDLESWISENFSKETFLSPDEVKKWFEEVFPLASIT